MDKISCPICTRLNDPQENRCWFCSAELHSAVPTPGGNDDRLGEMKEDPDAGNTILNDDTLKNIEKVIPSEDIPEWLARIRAREAAERAQQIKEDELLKAQKKSQGDIPDWLSSIGEGVDLSTPIEEPLPVESRDEGTEQVPPVPETELPPPAQGESEWLESLNSWQSVNVQENLTESEGITTTANDEVSDTPLGEDDGENDVASLFKPEDEINHPVIEDESDETPKGNKDENNEPVELISPEVETKDQIAQVFNELQSQVEPEDIVAPDLINAVIVSEEVEPALTSEVLEGGESINEVLSSEPMVNSNVGESISDTPIPAQAIIPE